MKKILILVFLLVSLKSIAQPVTSGRADTVMAFDPENKNLVEYKIRYADGKVRMIGNIMNGKKTGVWRMYSIRGMLENIIEYDGDEYNGIFIHFNDNGTTEYEQTYRHGKLHGRKTQWLYGSVTKLTEYYNEGLLDGEKMVYYESGKMQEKTYYKNGQREGLTVWYDQDEKPSIEYTYKNGLLNGRAKVYAKGVLQSEGNYVNGDEEGEWKIYEDGSLLKTVTYKNGKIIKESAAKNK